MASPALRSPSSSPLDPQKQGRFVVQIGDSLMDASSVSAYSSIKYNHKPSLSSGTRSTNMSRLESTQSTLTITDNEDDKISVYKYSGEDSRSRNSYALIFDQSSQTCILEHLDATYNFNIQSTPWESSSSRLAQQYPQLHNKAELGVRDEDDGMDEDFDAEPDEDNPYDYRHYVKLGQANSRSSSPVPRAENISNTSNQKPARSKPSTDTKSKTRPTAKTDPLRQTARKPINKAPHRPTPSVRLDRRASTRPGDDEKRTSKISKGGVKNVESSDHDVLSSDGKNAPVEGAEAVSSSHSDLEDDEGFGTHAGGLEIDFGDSPPTKRQNRALALPRSLHGGPISLHSAANSPSNHVVAPHQRTKNRKVDDVIDFGESSGGFEGDDDVDDGSDIDADPEPREKSGGANVYLGSGSEESGDDDVEPMILGPPAHQQDIATGEGENDADADADADFDAEFEAEMLQGLASQDDDAVPIPMAVDESEEESEAE